VTNTRRALGPTPRKKLLTSSAVDPKAKLPTINDRMIITSVPPALSMAKLRYPMVAN
jgi:hypothetical protein